MLKSQVDTECVLHMLQSTLTALPGQGDTVCSLIMKKGTGFKVGVKGIFRKSLTAKPVDVKECVELFVKYTYKGYCDRSILVISRLG